MGYIKRKGIVVNPFIVIFSGLVLTFLYIQGNWDDQYQLFTNFSIVTQNTSSTELNVLVIFSAVSILIATLWYFLGKIIAPIMVKIIVKFLGGIKSTAFIDRDINKTKISFGKFIGYYFNISVALFALDFFLAHSFLYRSNEDPTLYSLIISIIAISLLNPLHLTYDSVGIRSYNEYNAEVSAVSSILGRLVFRLVQTGGLLASLASLSFNTNIISQIPEGLKIIFFRTFFISTVALLINISFFQSEAIYKDWKDKGIPSGKTRVKIN